MSRPSIILARPYASAVAAGILVFLLNNVLLARIVTRLPGGTTLAATNMAVVPFHVLTIRRFGAVTVVYGTYGALGLAGHLGVDAATFDAVLAVGRHGWPS
jgi:hypothetical protein